MDIFSTGTTDDFFWPILRYHRAADTINKTWLTGKNIVPDSCYNYTRHPVPLTQIPEIVPSHKTFLVSVPRNYLASPSPSRIFCSTNIFCTHFPAPYYSLRMVLCQPSTFTCLRIGRNMHSRFPLILSHYVLDHTRKQFATLIV